MRTEFVFEKGVDHIGWRGSGLLEGREVRGGLGISRSGPTYLSRSMSRAVSS